LDTCLRPYDQEWINYQQEIALRHKSLKKNKVDGVRSTPYVAFPDVLAFIAVMNETIKPYFAVKGEFRRRGRADALDMVQVGADTTCALDRPLQVTPSRYQTSGDLCAVPVERLSICVKIRSNISA